MFDIVLNTEKYYFYTERSNTILNYERNQIDFFKMYINYLYYNKIIKIRWVNLDNIFYTRHYFTILRLTSCIK